MEDGYQFREVPQERQTFLWQESAAPHFEQVHRGISFWTNFLIPFVFMKLRFSSILILYFAR